VEEALKGKKSTQQSSLTFQRFREHCQGRRESCSPARYESVADFLIEFTLVNKGSTRSLSGIISHLKREYLLRDLVWLDLRGSIMLLQLVRQLRLEDISESSQKSALRWRMLQAYVATLNLDDPVQLMRATVLTLGHNGLFRSGELASESQPLTVGQILWDEEQRSVRIHLSRTKTVRAGPGAFIDVPGFDSEVCAVRLLCRWFKHRNLHRANPDTPLFPRVSRGGRFHKTEAITYRWVLHSVKAAAQVLGLQPEKFGGHSLRAGGATDLFAARTPYFVIKKMGRWASDAAMIYYRSEEDVVRAVSKAFSRVSKVPSAAAPVKSVENF
jgi:Phage integrase family